MGLAHPAKERGKDRVVLVQVSFPYFLFFYVFFSILISTFQIQNKMLTQNSSMKCKYIFLNV
jgi:hypothetical protein